MKKLVTTFLALAGSAIYFTVSAQQTKIDSLNSRLKKIVTPESKPNWIKFKANTNINPATLFVKFKSAFDLKENDKMVLSKTIKDDLGFTLYQYQQYYKNIKVDGAIYNVHANKIGVAYSANGKIFSGINMSVVPILSKKQAIDLALEYVKAKEYMWQSDFWEKNLKERTGKTDTTFFPTPQLVIKCINSRSQKNKTQNKLYFLVYSLDIYSSSPNYSQRIFIDAKTGEVLETFPLQSD